MIELPNNDDDRLVNVNRIVEYRQFAENADSGLFTRRTRRRLVGAKGLSGRDRTINDFWHDQRNKVKNALKDIEIFLLVSGAQNVRHVFTLENIKPLIGALLWNHGPESDVETGKIAQLLVESGLVYLRNTRSNLVTASHRQIIEHAIDISRLLGNPEGYGAWEDKEDEPE